MDQFDVTLNHEQPCGVLEIRGAQERAADWSLIELEVGPPYVAAVAVEGRDLSLRAWDLSDSSLV